MGVVTLQEIRWSGSESIYVKNTTIFYDSCDDKSQGGCGFVVINDILSVVKDFRAICTRISMLTVAARLFNIVFMNVHVLTK